MIAAGARAATAATTELEDRRRRGPMATQWCDSGSRSDGARGPRPRPLPPGGRTEDYAGFMPVTPGSHCQWQATRRA